MDGGASVLFIITIPTAAEEDRLKRELVSKKCELTKSEPGEETPGGKATILLKVDSNKTTTSAATLYATPIACGANNNDKNTDDIADVINTPTVNIPASVGDIHYQHEIDNELCSIEYNTCPKQRRLRRNPGTKELSNVIGTQQPAASSLSDVELNTTINRLPPARKSLESLKANISSSREKVLRKENKYIDLELERDICMETVLKEILIKFHIQDATWTKNVEGVTYQIFFTIEFNETYEKILLNLNEWGIGDREGSTVSVMNCITSKTYASQNIDDEMGNDFCTENKFSQKQSAWERFMNSVRSRLNVASIIRAVRQDAAITFDFVVLLVSAAILASFGLVENSTIFLASSMLISPLMGPINAAIFGTVIKDHSLRRLGLKNELFGIFIAVFVGFLFGLVVCTTEDRYSIGDGLTEEMLARCELHSLVVGVFTAIPSGAAAAIGILGGNIGSLVGVAISASLLPPAVNSGLLWALALIYKFFEKDDSRYNSVVKSALYSKNQATELAVLGSISMCLTISNIICIYIMGILVLKVKEIAPAISRNNCSFWKHDIKIARDLNRHGIDTDTAIIDEYENLPKEDQRVLGINCDLLRNIQLDESLYQNTWSPIRGRHSFEHTYEQIRCNYSTVHHLEMLYAPIAAHQHSIKDKRRRFLPRRHTGHSKDFGTSNKILNQNIPRCYTVPSKNVYPTINMVRADTTIMNNLKAGTTASSTMTITPTGTIDESKKRKFIVTPAEEDPLHQVYAYSEAADV